MKLPKSLCVVFIILLLSYFYVVFFLSIFPNTLFVTDFNIYTDIFSGDSEDTGFYPFYIALKELFRLIGLNYSHFQYFSGTIFVFSNTLFLNYIYKKFYSGLLLEILLAYGFIFCSFPLIKSFTLVKSFLSLSLLLLVFLILRNKSLPRIINFTLPLLPIFISPLSLPFSSLLYVPIIAQSKSYLISLCARFSLPRFSIPHPFLTSRLRVYTLLLIVSSLSVLSFSILLILRSPIFSGLDLVESIFSVYDLFSHKFDSYFPAVNWLLVLFSIFLFLVVFPTSSSLLSIIFAYSAFVGFGRVSIFLPYTLVSCSVFYPRFRPLFRTLLSAYMTFGIVKGLYFMQEL